MNYEQDKPAESFPEYTSFFAKRPFVTGLGEFVFDADGDRVIVCCEEDNYGCDLFYAESKVDASPHFMCPKCGRLGLRMEEIHARFVPKEMFGSLPATGEVR